MYNMYAPLCKSLGWWVGIKNFPQARGVSVVEYAVNAKSANYWILGCANGFLLSFWPALCAGDALSCGCPGCVASGCSSSFLFRSAVILPPVGCEWFGLCPEGGASSSVLAARQALQLVASELHQTEDLV